MNNKTEDLFTIIPHIETALAVPVLEADTLPEEVFKKDWVAQNKACLIKNAVKHWPAVQKWKDKDYWISVCEDFKVAVYPHMNHNNVNLQKMINNEMMSFYEAISRLFSGTDAIISMPGEKISEKNRFSGILKDLGEFTFLRFSVMPRIYERKRFFIYRGAATAWHYHDVDETLMCQINGGKRVALLPPHIPKPRYVSDFLLNESHLNGEILDHSLNLTPFIVNVEEGDALYIPPYWHHAVVPTDGEVGFTLAHCWRSPLHILGNFSNYFVRKLYYRGIWPLKKVTAIVPFLAIGAGFAYYKRKLFARA